VRHRGTWIHDIDRAIKVRVTFGDGSAVEICGRGSVLLSDVHFIPRLIKSNIISFGELDEIGCKYSAEDGVMAVLDQHRKLLVKVNKTRNRMYILNISHVEPVPTTHAKETS
jgi:hypothetical protein